MKYNVIKESDTLKSDLYFTQCIKYMIIYFIMSYLCL